MLSLKKLTRESVISDFGMMGEMPQNLRDSLIEACVHLVNRDFDALAEDFVALG
jgi:aarF domain-containing kinase